MLDHSQQPEITNKKTSIALTFWQKFWIGLISFLAAAGTGLQNFMSFFLFLNDIFAIGWAAGKGLAIFFGGICSGLVNLCMNIDLLRDFFDRLRGQKPKPNLTGWKKFRYWAGCIIFITTGVLFGLTAFAFGPIGALAALAITAGIFVAIIMTIQELETWLASFDQPDNKITLWDALVTWFKSLTPGRGIGFIIALGNILALSMLFTFGLTTFLTGIGIPLLPALITGFTLAFTVGAFTEFYFYNYFLAKYCDKFCENFLNLIKSEHPVWGLAIVTINGVVNGALCYAGVIALATLIAAAGLAAPPLGVAIAAAVLGGLASWLLGCDFWTRIFGLKNTTSAKLEADDNSPASTTENSVPSEADETPSPSITLSKSETVTYTDILQQPSTPAFWGNTASTNPAATLVSQVIASPSVLPPLTPNHLSIKTL